MGKTNEFDLNNRIICGTILDNDSVYVVTGVAETGSKISFTDKQILTLKQYRALLRSVSSFIEKQNIINHRRKMRKKNCQFDS